MILLIDYYLNSVCVLNIKVYLSYFDEVYKMLLIVNYKFIKWVSQNRKERLKNNSRYKK